MRPRLEWIERKMLTRTPQDSLGDPSMPWGQGGRIVVGGERHDQHRACGRGGGRRYAQSIARRIVGAAGIVPKIRRRRRRIGAERPIVALRVKAGLRGDIDLDAGGDRAIHERLVEKIPAVARSTHRLTERPLESFGGHIEAMREPPDVSMIRVSE